MGPGKSSSGEKTGKIILATNNLPITREMAEGYIALDELTDLLKRRNPLADVKTFVLLDPVRGYVAAIEVQEPRLNSTPPHLFGNRCSRCGSPVDDPGEPNCNCRFPHSCH